MAQSNPGKARLLEAAIDLLAEGGNARATINEICRIAEVRPPALYYHYGNKEGLVAAAVDAVSAAWLDELERAVSVGSTFEERLSAGLNGWRALILERRSALLLLVRVQLESAEASPVIRTALLRIMARAREIIATAIEGVTEPLDDADELAGILIDLVQGAALRHHLENDRARLDRHISEIGQTISALVESRLAGQATVETTRKTS
jgi:TetR/AcrR family acrAB operon transcriptional repressor